MGTSCSLGLSIELHADGDGVTAGSYAVGIVADGDAQSCDLTISDDPAVCLGGPHMAPALGLQRSRGEA